MKTFEYRGLDVHGGVQRGLVEAPTLKEARERLAAEGILAERLSASGRRIRLPTGERAAVYRELSALLGAGLPLVRALDLLIASPGSNDRRLCLAGLRDRIKEGRSLPDAMAESSPSVTDFENAILEAAERSATVETSLERLADFLEERETVRQQVKSALVYPAMVVLVGIFVAVLMLGLLVPRARALLSAGGTELPALTVFMIGLGDALAAGILPALLLAAGAAAWLRRRLGRDAAFRIRWNRRLFRLPLAGRGYALLVNERFGRTLAMLVRGGIPMTDGIVLAGRATGSAWVAELAAAAAEAVRHGGKLSDAIGRVPPLADSLPGWIQIGEAGGDMARLLENAAERSGRHWKMFMKRGLSLLEPLLILAIGGFVLVITLAVLLPVFNLSKAL